MPTLKIEMEILQTIELLCQAVEEKLPQWLNIRTPEGFLSMEEEAHCLGRGLADGLTAAIVRQRLQNPELTAQCVSHAQQTGKYKPNGSRSARVTLLGGSTIEVRTAYMPPVARGRSKGWVGIWPVLAALGIWWRTTPALCSEVNRQVADSNSFRDALASLQRRGIDLEYKRALTLVHRFGQRAVDQRRLWLEHVLEPSTRAVQGLRDEVARLKGNKPKPKIPSSKLDKNREKRKRKQRRNGKRPGSAKRSKTAELQIHETVEVPPQDLPEGSRFKGYEDYTVQDIQFCSHNTVYRLERWETPDGKTVIGKLPQGVGVGHFGTTLVSFILYQHYHAHVTQPLILEQLQDVQVDISAGQLSRIITEGKERFHAEKDEILRVGLQVSPYIHVDDTGARHDGKNGYCTHIGNELFAWFQSTDSKSRINFLELLRADHGDYVVNEQALSYMRAQRLPKGPLARLATCDERCLETKEQWEALLAELDIRGKRHLRIATEGALLGSVLEHGLKPDLVVISDDAGQFDLILILHALCWIHAERTINKLVGFNDEQREALEQIRTRIWDFYDELKAYKVAPSAMHKAALQVQFDDIFTTKTCFATLNAALVRLHKNKSELLLVLDHPDIPLHNNLSERDIREYVKKRKISGSTRSERGRRCRDTFASLKKTCRKLGVSFWSYLKDRISGEHSIAPLPDLIRLKAEVAFA